MFIIARHLDTWNTCAVAVTTIVSDHPHTAISLHNKQGHALPIARSIAGPAAWNALPASVRNTDSHAAFCRRLKTYLFSLSD